MKLYSKLWETGGILKCIMYLVYNCSPGIYSIEMKTYVPIKNSTCIFIVALITIAQNWKQSSCPSKEQWSNSDISIPWKNSQE